MEDSLEDLLDGIVSELGQHDSEPSATADEKSSAIVLSDDDLLSMGVVIPNSSDSGVLHASKAASGQGASTTDEGFESLMYEDSLLDSVLADIGVVPRNDRQMFTNNAGQLDVGPQREHPESAGQKVQLSSDDDLDDNNTPEVFYSRQRPGRRATRAPPKARNPKSQSEETDTQLDLGVATKAAGHGHQPPDLDLDRPGDKHGARANPDSKRTPSDGTLPSLDMNAQFDEAKQRITAARWEEV